MSLNAAYSFVSLLLFLAAFLYLSLLRAKSNKSPHNLILILLIALIVMLLPIADNPVFYYLRGYIGDLSVTSSIFFAAYLLQRGFGKEIYRPVELRFLMSAIVACGLLLYPMALGLGQFDPYRPGYYPQGFLVILFCFAVFFWFKGYYFLLFVVTSVVIGFTAGLLESNNLWDYLLDAVLWLAFVLAYLFSGAKRLLKSRKQP